MSGFSRHILLVSIIALSSCMSTATHAQNDWFEKLDQQFEKTFTQTDAAFERAMTEGVEELDHELAAIWGENRRLPDAKVWVGYSRDLKTRVIVDYEQGELSVEGFGQNEQELRHTLQNLLQEDSRQLDKRDHLRTKLSAKTKTFRPRDKKKVPSAPTKNHIAIQRNTSHELAQLIVANERPVFVKRRLETKNTRQPLHLSRLSLHLRKDRDRLTAQALRLPIIQAAQKYALPKSLLLSVIKNESAFNPRARSHANALGLMQLVPTSAGKEAYSFLKGKEAIPGTDILYNPHHNILLGSTYLHLLNTRYFGKVTNEQTRQYLIIAAYNTGAGNVAKAFTGQMKLRPAIQKINTMTPQAVYAYLQTHLPYKETRSYLAKVSKDTQIFASWDA